MKTEQSIVKISFFTVGNATTFSLVQAKQWSFEYGKPVLNEEGLEISPVPVEKPEWGCNTCAAWNVAHLDETCWCCGNRKKLGMVTMTQENKTTYHD
jgi:hypothetical protein